MIDVVDAYDPERAEAEFSTLEAKVDAFIKESLFDNVRQGAIFKPYHSLTRNMAQELVKRYSRAGWVVDWDQDRNCPYFAFSFPKPKRKRRWWLLWIG